MEFPVDASVGRDMLFQLRTSAVKHTVSAPYLIRPDGTLVGTATFDSLIESWTIKVPLAEVSHGPCDDQLILIITTKGVFSHFSRRSCYKLWLISLFAWSWPRHPSNVIPCPPKGRNMDVDSRSVRRRELLHPSRHYGQGKEPRQPPYHHSCLGKF